MHLVVEPDMSHPTPEWITTTIVRATLVRHGRAQSVRVQVGLARLPGNAGVRIASKVQDSDEWFVLPPASAAQVIGALKRSLRE